MIENVSPPADQVRTEKQSRILATSGTRTQSPLSFSPALWRSSLLGQAPAAPIANVALDPRNL